MAADDRIAVDPMICHGVPVIRGTRVPVRVVVGSLAGGMTPTEIQREYDISAEDIRAAEAFCPSRQRLTVVAHRLLISSGRFCFTWLGSHALDVEITDCH